MAHDNRPDCDRSGHNADFAVNKGVEKMNVGGNIRRIREEMRMKQADVAKGAGITQAMLCQIERGTRNPSLQVGKAIADTLGCTIDALLEEEPVTRDRRSQ